MSDEVFGYGGPTQVERPKLRPYQERAVDDLRRTVASGKRSALLVMPTGSGKTITSCEVISAGRAKGNRALFLAPRRELVYQTCEKLEALGVEYGILMAGEKPNLDAPVQVATVPTIHRRIASGMEPPDADLIIIDEAHCTFSQSARDVLKHYPRAVKIGMTATPARADGRGLGQIYDAMVEGPTVRELTDLGHLVPVRYFTPSTVDLSGVQIRGGDYDQKQLSQKVQDTPQLIGGVVENWLRICPERKTVVFAVDRAHAFALHEEFLAADIPSAYLDGKTPNAERAQILRAIRSGDIRVICSVDVLSYGWDEPSVSCGIIARPTKSLARYLQSAGRILRPFPGKDDAILIDHTGCVRELGFIDDRHPWTLDGKLGNPKKLDADKSAEENVRELECPQCHALFEPRRNCPSCGHDMTRQRRRAIAEVDAQLRELRVDRSKDKHWHKKFGASDPARFYAELKGYASTKGYKPGWAYMQFKNHFGVAPPHDVKAIAPSPAVESWCKARLIRYAKGKAKANRDDTRARILAEREA